MNMIGIIRVKVETATGPILDWMVAAALAQTARFDSAGVMIHHPIKQWISFSPSTDWNQGGPIINQEIDCVRKRSKAEEAALAYPNPRFKFKAEIFADSKYCCGFGPTMLIAAMRCFVISKLGSDVDVPISTATAYSTADA